MAFLLARVVEYPVKFSLLLQNLQNIISSSDHHLQDHSIVTDRNPSNKADLDI
uniref:Uncharacterized protein n=1 Tax=Oryza brachyantha TaxID=4533 RepID=J3LA30_ORYBR